MFLDEDDFLNALEYMSELSVERSNALTEGIASAILTLLSRQSNWASPGGWYSLTGIVELLIEKGADVNHKNADERTPLLELCRNYGNDDLIEIVKFLINKGAVVKHKDSYGRTPLLELCLNTKLIYKPEELTLKIAKLFCMHGADVNAADLLYGRTPLLELCRKCRSFISHRNVIQLLMDIKDRIQDSNPVGCKGI